MDRACAWRGAYCHCGEVELRPCCGARECCLAVREPRLLFQTTLYIRSQENGIGSTVRSRNSHITFA